MVIITHALPPSGNGSRKGPSEGVDGPCLRVRGGDLAPRWPARALPPPASSIHSFFSSLRSPASMSSQVRLGTDLRTRPETAEKMASAASTPVSEQSEEDSGVTGSTTVTTELIPSKTGGASTKESFTLTHTGVRGISHQVDTDGSVHLRPSSNRKGKKIRALVSFKARESHFDRHNKDVARDPFRGFYTLFWIGLTILILNTFYTSFDTTGQIISLTFATLFSKDAIVLAISDGVLVASTFVCVPFAYVLKKGWCRYWPTLIWLQHTWQALLLAAVIRWTHYR